MRYATLVEVYEQLEKTPSRLGKTDLIAGLLADTPTEELDMLTLLLQGRVFPSWSEKEIGIANQLMQKIIATAIGIREQQVIERFRKTGDFGLIIEELTAAKRQQTLFKKSLTISHVFENLQKLASMEGKGSQERKFGLVAELLGSATPLEAKYIVRTTLGTLRIGTAEGVLRDAIAKAFFADVVWTDKRIAEIVTKEKGTTLMVEKGLLEKLEKKQGENIVESLKKNNTVKETDPVKLTCADLWKAKNGMDYLLLLDEKRGNELKKALLDAIEFAWFVRPDYGEVAQIAKEKGLAGLQRITLTVGKPYHVLLAEKAPSLEEALQTYERPAIEMKFDGVRLCVHKKGERIWLFTRRLEDVTRQFPDLVALATKAITADTCIVEGEILGIDKNTGAPLPFQQLSQRVKRKYDIDEMVKKIPVQVNLFDITSLNGASLFAVPFHERRKRLESIIKEVPGQFQLAKQLVTRDLTKAEEFYTKALRAHQEGVMVKNLDALYQPGRRVGYWLKVKPTMENLDLAIIGAEYGTGKRAGWFGTFVLGCRDDDGNILPCGMIGTGVKEKEESGGVTFRQLTELLKPHVEKREGKAVTITPTIVVEVAYEEIQKSPTYESGYALRFPRVLRIRDDKSIHDVDSLPRIQRLYQQQRGKG